MKIALFGTSADPPTAGHQAVLIWLSHHYDSVAVWAADNPFKSHQTSLENRVEMLRLLIGDISPARENISLEQELSDLRTINTVEKAKKRWGNDAEFVVVIGSDLLSQFQRWYRIEDLLREAEVLVIPRPGYTIDNSSLDPINELGGKIAVANLTGLDVSSTAYREHGDTQALTNSVAAYINQKHLYECQDSTTTKVCRS
ncbi:nicotinate/nicotinamide nucleotide adenylyltransferase [Rivularia sp. PCC 7116]|uniref:nicotinate-nucleotide adenylyltransferase n=1 Tax=Rivularia sp. PCC 7116 TaxID=373994 RepID=UPI00029EF802|nr:nicotinate-nucleotide adenylyltransferase [Rivularia sp. PCC 7116]AFY58783.1 nicotinate/nicotinamide nucleotide adenylyltransferase [Rivularia sp. PCC 7116]